MFAALGLLPRRDVAAFAVVFAGALGMVWNLGGRVLRQTVVPDALLGRVTATVAFVALIAAPVGGLLGGLIAQQHGVRWPAAVAVVTVAATLFLLRPVTGEAVAAATAAVDA